MLGQGWDGKQVREMLGCYGKGQETGRVWGRRVWDWRAHMRWEVWEGYDERSCCCCKWFGGSFPLELELRVRVSLGASGLGLGFRCRLRLEEGSRLSYNHTRQESL